MKKSTVLILTAVAVLTALGLTAPTASGKSFSGTPGNDIIRGTSGNDVIRAFGGNDVIYAGAGDDSIDAGSGRDIARGEAGHDEVSGGRDGDTLYGGAGPDWLDGESGRDILRTTDGRGGNDSANGGPGSDICHGDPGDGHESCSFSGGPTGRGGNTPDRADTASGRCSVVGYIVFAEPVGAAPERTTFTDYAEGTCTGTVNGKFMANERIYLRARGGGVLSCSLTQVRSTGVLVFTRNTPTPSDDVHIDYTAHSQGTAGQVVSRARGRVSGEILANVRFRGDQDTLRQCQAGTFRRGAYDMDGQTVTPIVG